LKQNNTFMCRYLNQ